MPSVSDFHDSLQTIADRVNNDMSERDVENLFLETGFYDALGYEGTGTDIRSEFTLPDDRRPDYITLNTNEEVSVVYEFKKPSRDLSGHEDQLFHYVDQLQADYGVLANGKTLRVYKPDGSKLLPPQALGEVTDGHARDLVTALQKRDYDLTNAEDVRVLLDPDPVSLDEDTELGQEHFFDTFRLEEGSAFANLVVGLMDALDELRGEDDEEAEKFVQGAYDFWEATYASEPESTPSSWEPFIDGKQSLRDFMFCLETGHALLSRLLLAKATEDHDFFHRTTYDGMGGYFRGHSGFGNTINLDAFPVAANNLIDDMQEQLVEGLFQDDIFVWWTVGYRDVLSSGHDTGGRQFRYVAKEESGVELLTDATRDRFSRAVAEVFFNILRFDFSNVEGDLLGDLYQQYFDPETRKALGEFYTPQPVVDYIMDGVSYDRGVSNERLMDPACGSGTFLVEAVERYLEDVERYATGEPDWEERLRELCTQPHIVGLDIHPFAVLMAQIRFVVAILPKYREAKEQNQHFTLRRLPIYRTDTLRNERELTGADLGDEDTWQMTWDAMTESEQDVLIPVPLPIEVDEDEVSETEDGFLVRRVRMPLFDTIKLNTGVRNFGEYFAALQGVLDTVKDHIAAADKDQLGSDFDWTYHSGLEENVNRYTSQEYDGVEEFFKPYVNDMLENVRYLKEEHNDGRLFKMLEDAVLSLVVKNYMEYEYVVGNPPYVRIQNLPDSQKRMMDTLYEATTGNYDIYCPFYERGLNWLRDNSGKLGYITSNQFFVTNYGEGLRNVIRGQAEIEKVCDFRDIPLFEGATNYPAILFLSPQSDRQTRNKNEIRCIRLRGDVNRNEQALTDTVMDRIRENESKPGHTDKYIDVFDYVQGDLDDGYWSFCPPEEREVIQKIRQEGERQVKDVTDAIFHGTQPGWNKVYVVTPVDADRISSTDSGGTVTVVPRGGSEEYDIETDLLRPWLQGRDVQRWQCEWSGQHVILPYHIERSESGIEVNVCSQDYLKSNLPKTWNYFKEHEDVLKRREGGMMRDREDWYAFTYPKSHHRFEQPKIVGRQFSDHAQFMLDSNGDWYFKGAYGVQLEPRYQNKTDEVCCQLNSNVLDFHFKHIATQKQGGYYAYRKQYIGESPCFISEQPEFETLREKSAEISTVLDLEAKTDRFPEAYLGDYDGELDYVTYEWQTRRYPVNAEVQEEVDGEFTVQAGRSDIITDPAMYADDRDARKLRAQYVYEAVNGRNVKSGEEMTIPIPQADSGVKELLDELKADEQTVDETDLEELEAEIDAAVYNLFDLNEEEQDIIEGYLEVF